MFNLEKFNQVLGTDFSSVDDITDHQLLAALVTLLMFALDGKVFECNPTEAFDAIREEIG